MAQGIPSWVSYTLTQPTEMVSEISWRLDARLEENDLSICNRIEGFASDFRAVPLFPFGMKDFFRVFAIAIFG